MYKYILFLLLFPTLAISQDGEDTVAYSIDLENFVVTAQYEPTHYKKAIHNIRIIKKETIERLGAVTLDRLLVTVPTIRLVRDPILGTTINLRGVKSSNVAILIDGVPVIGRNGGGIDISQLSLQNVERIEIIEGPLSNLYGNNAAGGVINIITKTSQVDQWDMSIGTQIENIGQSNYFASIGYQKGDITLGVNGRYFLFDQYPPDSLRLLLSDSIGNEVISSAKYPFNPKEQYALGSLLRYQFDPNQHLLIKYDYNSENVTDYGIVKRKQFNPYAEDQFYNTVRNDISIKYKGQFKNGFYTSGLLAYNRYNRIRNDKRYYLESMTFDSLIQSNDSIGFQQIFTRVDINYTRIKNWNFGFGSSFTKESGQGDRLIEPQKIDSISTDFSETAAYVDLKYLGIKRLELGITSRALLHSTYDNALISSFLLKYQINDKLLVRSGIAQGYRSPSLKELYLDFVDFNHNIKGNQNLQPERSLDLQTSINYHNSHIDISFGTYYTAINDRIALAEYETLKFRYENIDNYRVFGFQPSLTTTFKKFTLTTGGSIGFWSVGIANGLAPKFGRVLDINNAITYAIKKYNTSVMLNLRYFGKQPNYRILDNELIITTLEGYSLIDLSISKHVWNKRLKLVTGVKNILNISTVNNSGVNGSIHSGAARRVISPGRSFFLTASLEI